MMSVMKKPKRAKTPEHEDGVDMINELPDHILRLILSRLPTTEEVNRTSILSTRWRPLWTSVPSIGIDYSRVHKPPKKFNKNKFKRFVNWVLANKSVDLDNFHLNCSNRYNMPTIVQWINAAITKNVKLLDLKFYLKNESKAIVLPHSLSTCSSLEVLRLFTFGHRLRLPRFTGFPALRVLELKNVELFNDCLINCNMLEDLSLIDCLMDKLVYLVINCPKLKNLKIDNRNKSDYLEKFESVGLCGSVFVFCPELVRLEFGGHIAYHFLFESLDSLEKAVIRPEDTLLEEFSFDPIPYALHLPVSLPNLKTLELRIDCLIVDKIIEFLKCLPDLESLHLIIPQWFLTSKHGDLGQEERRRILTRRLKRVEFIEFKGEQEKLEKAEFLLEHGDALEEMVFNWSNEAKYHEMSMDTMKKVSKFHKASSCVKVITLLRPDIAVRNDIAVRHDIAVFSDFL